MLVRVLATQGIFEARWDLGQEAGAGLAGHLTFLHPSEYFPLLVSGGTALCVQKVQDPWRSPEMAWLVWSWTL